MCKQSSLLAFSPVSGDVSIEGPAMVTQTLWLKNPASLFEATKTADFTPVMAWVNDAETGKRRPSTTQAVTDEGLPIWEIRLIATQDSYGRAEDVFLTLRLASRGKPDRALLAKVTLTE